MVLSPSRIERGLKSRSGLPLKRGLNQAYLFDIKVMTVRATKSSSRIWNGVKTGIRGSGFSDGVGDGPSDAVGVGPCVGEGGLPFSIKTLRAQPRLIQSVRAKSHLEEK